MCAQWEGWDGTPVREPPLFYTGLSELAADILSNASDEVMQLSKVVNEKSGVDTSQVIYEHFLGCAVVFENFYEPSAKLHVSFVFSKNVLYVELCLIRSAMN